MQLEIGRCIKAIVGRFVSAVRGLMAILTVCSIVGCAPNDKGRFGWEHSLTGLYDADISVDGRLAIVSSFSDGTSLWDIPKNRRLFDWRHNDSGEDLISHVRFSPNAAFAITADRRTFVIWDTASGKARGFWGTDADIIDAAVADDGRIVLLGLKDGRAVHMNVVSARRLEVIAHRNEWVTTVALSADGRIALTGGNDGRAMAWDAISGDELHQFEHGARMVKVAIDPTHARVMTADETGKIYIWSMQSGNRLAKLDLERHQRVITAARFSSSGKRLLLGFPGRSVSLVDSASGKSIASWQTPSRKKGWVPQGSTVYAVAFDAAERSVLAESSNGLGTAWRMQSGG